MLIFQMFGVSPLTSVHSGDTSGAGAGGAGQVDENICFISIFNIASLLSQRIINISVGCFS